MQSDSDNSNLQDKYEKVWVIGNWEQETEKKEPGKNGVYGIVPIKSNLVREWSVENATIYL